MDSFFIFSPKPHPIANQNAANLSQTRTKYLTRFFKTVELEMFELPLKTRIIFVPKTTETKFLSLPTGACAAWGVGKTRGFQKLELLPKYKFFARVPQVRHHAGLGRFQLLLTSQYKHTLVNFV